MNRRSFSKHLAGAALGSSALGSSALGSSALGSSALGSAALESAEPDPRVPYSLSVMLWTVFTNLQTEQRLERIVEAGYTNVELIGEYRKWSEEEFTRVNTRRKQLGITFDITAGLKHGAANPDDRAALMADIRNELPIMERLDIPAMIVMSGNVVAGMPGKTQHASCIESLKRAAALVEGKQINGQPVRVLLENIDPEENPKYYLTSVAEGFEIVRAVNHPQVRLLYDFYHEQISEGNLIEKLEKNIEYTGLVHIADVPGRHIPGTGEINYDSIYRKLVELKYDRMVAMEFIPLHDGVDELKRAKAQALRGGRLS